MYRGITEQQILIENKTIDSDNTDIWGISPRNKNKNMKIPAFQSYWKVEYLW